MYIDFSYLYNVIIIIYCFLHKLVSSAIIHLFEQAFFSSLYRAAALPSFAVYVHAFTYFFRCAAI